jgi:hypothetical protein
MKRPYEDELDARLIELFRSVEQPEPSAGFASRTMKAVRVAPLPAGRLRLRDSWSIRCGWAAFVGAAAAMGYAVVNLPVTARMFAATLGLVLHTASDLARLVFSGLVWSEVLTTIGRAVAMAAATPEGMTALMATAIVACIAVSALHRLLASEREASQWQELS